MILSFNENKYHEIFFNEGLVMFDKEMEVSLIKRNN